NAMHRFISLVSHKLRTPLVVLRGYPPLLLAPNAENPLDRSQREAIETIQRESMRMESLVNELIAFSSLEPGEISRQPVGVGELLEVAQNILPSEYKKQASKMKIDPETAKMVVDVDPTLMQHAFRNLIENAFKFGAKQVEIKGKRENGAVTV